MLATLYRAQLLFRDVVLAHHATRLVRPDNRRAGVLRDVLRAMQVIEVAVANEHVVSAIDVLARYADRWRGRHAVHVCVEEQHEVIDTQLERRDAKPLDGDVHGGRILANAARFETRLLSSRIS